jgi:outer membrane protein
MFAQLAGAQTPSRTGRVTPKPSATPAMQPTPTQPTTAQTPIQPSTVLPTPNTSILPDAATTRVAIPDDRTILLEEAIRIALQNSTALQKAQQNVMLQDLNIEQAVDTYLPSADAGMRYNRAYGNSFDQRAGKLSSSSSSSFGTDVSFGIPIFQNGFLNRISPELNQNAPAVKQARLEKESATQTLERSKEQVVFGVVTGYLEVLRAREQIQIQEENLTAQRQQLLRIQQFVKAGTKAPVDEMQQQANTAQAELQLVQLQRAYELAKTRLIQTLQIDPFQEYNFQAPSIEGLNTNREGYNVNEMIRSAMANRNDVKAQKTTIEANELAIKLTRLSRFPSIAFSAGLGTGYSSNAANSFPRQMQDNWSANWGLSFNFTIFDKGQVRRQVQQAQIRKDAASLDLTSLEQSIAVEVRQSYLDYISAGKEFEVSQTQLNYTKQALDAEQSRYNLGASTLTELTQARANYVNAQSQKVQSLYSFVFQKQVMAYYMGLLKP